MGAVARGGHNGCVLSTKCLSFGNPADRAGPVVLPPRLAPGCAFVDQTKIGNWPRCPPPPNDWMFFTKWPIPRLSHGTSGPSQRRRPTRGKPRSGRPDPDTDWPWPGPTLPPGPFPHCGGRRGASAEYRGLV